MGIVLFAILYFYPARDVQMSILHAEFFGCATGSYSFGLLFSPLHHFSLLIRTMTCCSAGPKVTVPAAFSQQGNRLPPIGVISSCGRLSYIANSSSPLSSWNSSPFPCKCLPKMPPVVGPVVPVLAHIAGRQSNDSPFRARRAFRIMMNYFPFCLNTIVCTSSSLLSC